MPEDFKWSEQAERYAFGGVKRRKGVKNVSGQNVQTVRMAKIMKVLGKGVISESEAISALKEAEEIGDPTFLAKVRKEIRVICPEVIQ